MSPIYNAAYLRGLAVTRLRIDELGRIVEAEGYDEQLRHWTYLADYGVSARVPMATWSYQ